MKDLTEIRKEINEIDNDLLKLWEKRMDICLEVADYKKAHGLAVLDSKREEELLYRIASAADDDKENMAVALYKTIMALSKSYQYNRLYGDCGLVEKIKFAVENTAKVFPKKAVVACQGIEGAYSQAAAEKIFPLCHVSFFRSFEDVVNAVEKGLCQYGILPIENSTAGSVNAVYDLMAQHNFTVARSVRVKIDHCLLCNKCDSDSGASIENIKEVYSHEQAIHQCSDFLKAHPWIKVNVCENTAVASQKVRNSGRNDVAAISSFRCSQIYNLETVASSIQNHDNNYTRFICISKNLEIYPGADKTSFVVNLPHKPGALYSVLQEFNARQINLLKIESRPIANSDFQFLFYFDISCSVYDNAFYEIINYLSKEMGSFRYLGSYTEVVE